MKSSRTVLTLVLALIFGIWATGCGGGAGKEGPKVMPKKFPGQGAPDAKGAPSGPPTNK